MTIYGSQEHEEMVNQILGVLEPQYLGLAEEIDGITPNEKIIWHLTSLWMNAAKRLDRDKLPVHKEQFKFILYSVGHIVELLSDTEWDQVEDEWMEHLARLRTFNDGFLGLYFHNKEISERTADFYNIYAWLITLYHWFGSSVYQKIKPRITDETSESYLIANQSMTNLLANLTEFTERYQIKEDVSSFIQQGLNLVINRPANFPWDLYFEAEKGEVKLPSFSPPKSSEKS
ncbi:MAG: hypothetical protein RLZZ410_634 [Pseudomonadota bacterium]|jgi:hypothetical protein